MKPNRVRAPYGTPIFLERQYFRQFCFWMVIIVLTACSLSLFLLEGMPVVAALLTSISIMAIGLWFAALRLDTVITNEGIFVKFRFLWLKWRHYPWERVDATSIRQYRPLVEYGGWGLRYGYKGLWNNKAYNVSGNMGLQLDFTDGTKLLIGTNKPDQMIMALKSNFRNFVTKAVERV